MRRYVRGMAGYSAGKPMDILKDLDQDFVKETISGKHFAEYFYRDSKDEAIKAYLKELH